MADDAVRTLLFSTLYPSSLRPGHGIFVETRLRELLKTGGVETRVVSPVPWFVSSHPRFGAYAVHARTPRRETLNGVEVHRPRYLQLPKVGMTISPLAMALAAVPTLRRLLAERYDFDLIDAHYYYPDGVAAALLGRWFDRPVVVTARGSDLNLIAGHRLPRRMMQWAARTARASIGVSGALVDVLRGWGLDPARLHLMRNGVDLDRFRPLPMDAARRRLGLADGPVLLSVGNLVTLKGHDLTIQALAALTGEFPDAVLCLIGEGPERARLVALAARLGLSHRVRFVGAVANAGLAHWYGAADVSVLASSREGWANVLLESMACGTPVVATRVGGTPEVLADAAGGRLVDVRDVPHLADALAEVLRSPPDRRAIRRHAEAFGWEATSRSQLALFRTIAAERADA